LLPERIKQLEVGIGPALAGSLLRESQYLFSYAADDPGQPAISLLMPPSRMLYQDGDLFPSMDMNLPEGFLFQRILELHPKRTLNKMHLLALAGHNAIGRVGFSLPGASPAAPSATISKQSLLRSTQGPDLFDQLVAAYLSTGTGISGVQPKVMVPGRASLPVPNLIVKTAAAAYPGLAANEYLCLSAARAAGLALPPFDLSDDGSLLVVDRFDLTEDGGRLGFEDVAALMGRRVHDRFSNRKYEGSYEAMAEAVGLFSADRRADLARLFEQIALSIMVRNGDAHLKNFGLLYSSADDARVSPLFDVVTTTVYRYERSPGFEDVDRTLALRLRKGRHASRAYPDTAELRAFAREICGVAEPARVLERIAQGMSEALSVAARDERMPPALLAQMREQWALGMAHATQQAVVPRRRRSRRPPTAASGNTP